MSEAITHPEFYAGCPSTVSAVIVAREGFATGSSSDGQRSDPREEE